jgi:hypothetical protein
MAATDLDAHTGTARAQGRRSDTCHILCQSQRGATAKEPERLTITLVDLHTSHTRIVLGRGDKLHPEGGTQIWFGVDDLVYFFYVHFLIFLLLPLIT